MTGVTTRWMVRVGSIARGGLRPIGEAVAAPPPCRSARARLGDGHGCERRFCTDWRTDADLGGRQRPNWSTRQNWSPEEIPSRGDNLVFPASLFFSSPSTTWSICRSTPSPSSGGYTISGLALEITGDPGLLVESPAVDGDRWAEPHSQQGSDTRRHQRRDARAVGPYHCQELREARCRHARAFRRERRHHRSGRRGRLRRDSGNQPAGAGRVTGRAHSARPELHASSRSRYDVGQANHSQRHWGRRAPQGRLSSRPG